MSEAGEPRAATPPWARALLSFLAYLLLTLAFQWTSFGDTNRHADEIFYFLVGQRMHDGLLPYIDVWDRKPFGLFLIYYLIAGISKSVWSYQIVACLFAAATAVAITKLVAYLSGWRGGVLAGLTYVIVIQPFEGASGQSPDFYNLFVATAALLVVLENDRVAHVVERSWRGVLAMGLCGFAITVKQTALFESVFLGCSLLAAFHRAGAGPGRIAWAAAAYATIGAMPTALFAAGYAVAGHWPEYWQAMVLSNFARGGTAGAEVAWKALGLLLRLAVLLPLAAIGVLGDRHQKGRRFVLWWLAAALLGFLSVPNATVHYALPALVPLSVAAGLAFGRRRFEIALFVALVLYALLWTPLDRRASTRGSIAAMDEMAMLIERHDGGGGLLVFDGPSYLYAMTGKVFLSPLVFPHHLNHQVENDVSHLSTHAEIARMLAGRPGVIVISRLPLNHPVNVYSRAQVLAYARSNCPFSRIVKLPEGPNVFDTLVIGDCAR